MEVVEPTEIPELPPVKTGADILASLKTEKQSGMFRKVIRKMDGEAPNPFLSTLIKIMGDDPEPLPKTPKYAFTTNFRRGRGRGRGRDGRGRGRGEKRQPRDPRERRGNPWERKVQVQQPNTEIRGPMQPPKKKAEIAESRPENEEDMEQFFIDIETLEPAERNELIKQRITELLSENKLLREANRRLVVNDGGFASFDLPLDRNFPASRFDMPNERPLHPADIRRSPPKSKPMNALAPEFHVSPDKNKESFAPLPGDLPNNAELPPVGDDKDLSYEDFVRLRRFERERELEELEYEEMLAEQMYLEEMEMRRYQEMENLDRYGEYPPRGHGNFDPRFAQEFIPEYNPRFY